MAYTHGAMAEVDATPQGPRVFWGWWIFTGAIITQFVTIGFAAQVTGVFLGPMTEDLGWSRSEFVLAASVGFAIGGISGFVIGPLIDRYGARPIVLFGGTLGGLSLIAVSQIDTLWQFIVVRGALSQVGLFMVGPFVVNATLSKWFVVNRGRVIALASIGPSLGGIIPPLALTPIVDNYGWETGWVVLGIATLVLVYPCALVMRREPEDYGLLPDGKTGYEEQTEEQRRQMEMVRRDFMSSYTRGEAVRTSAMWLLAVGFALGVAVVASLFAHFIPFMTDAGYTRQQAAFVFAAQGGVALVSKFYWAWIMQRRSPRGLAVLSMAMMGISVALLPTAADTSLIALLFVFSIAGFGVGGMFPLFDFVWAWYFGRRYIASVRSTGLPISVVIAVMGPILTGFYHDVVGNYTGAFLALAVVIAIGATLLLVSRRPAPKQAPEAPSMARVA
ncbi:MAG: MFS transporter [Chloroflexi bacterium]|nr:MFS transporter [Chloroflexota bacterium]